MSNEIKCKKCKDTGWYHYDHNHAKICEACCLHDKGSWLLPLGYSNAGSWCCLKGCGHTEPAEF